MRRRELEKKLENTFDININGYNGLLYRKLQYMYINYKELVLDYCYLDFIKLDIADNYTRDNRLFWTVRDEIDNILDILYYKIKKDNDILEIKNIDDLEYNYMSYYYNLIKD